MSLFLLRFVKFGTGNHKLISVAYASIFGRKAMKMAFILIPAAVILVLGACSANLAANHQLLMNQDKSMSPDTVKTCSPPLLEETPNDPVGGRYSNSRDHYTNKEVTNNSETSEDEGDLNKPPYDNLVNNEVNSLLNKNLLPEDVPIPDGRIFSRGEPPYGYLPTVNPKENIAIPLTPIDFDG
jgi:hypothetical protein